LLFVSWFISGIGMIYAGGMPGLTAEERLARMPALDWSRVLLTPAEAARKGKLARGGGRVVL
jgi:predicted ATPase